jgi:hypothetical protein
VAEERGCDKFFQLSPFSWGFPGNEEIDVAECGLIE